MDAIEKMVIVAYLVRRAYAGWAEFQPLFLYLWGRMTPTLPRQARTALDAGRGSVRALLAR